MARRQADRRPRPNRRGWREVPDAVGVTVEPLLPPARPTRRGRRPLNQRRGLNGILYALRTGCQWQRLPREDGSGSRGHRDVQAWGRAGVFRKRWARCRQEYEELRGIAGRWPRLDRVTIQAPVRLV